MCLPFWLFFMICAISDLKKIRYIFQRDIRLWQFKKIANIYGINIIMFLREVSLYIDFYIHTLFLSLRLLYNFGLQQHWWVSMCTILAVTKFWLGATLMSLSICAPFWLRNALMICQRVHHFDHEIINTW